MSEMDEHDLLVSATVARLTTLEDCLRECLEFISREYRLDSTLSHVDGRLFPDDVHQMLNRGITALERRT